LWKLDKISTSEFTDGYERISSTYPSISSLYPWTFPAVYLFISNCIPSYPQMSIDIHKCPLISTMISNNLSFHIHRLIHWYPLTYPILYPLISTLISNHISMDIQVLILLTSRDILPFILRDIRPGGNLKWTVMIRNNWKCCQVCIFTW
jgi:hypothetical protein